MSKNNARVVVPAVVGLLVVVSIAVLVVVSTIGQRTRLTLPVGKPTSVSWPSTTPGSVTKVDIVIARITLADDPVLGNGRKVANVRIFFRNASSEPVDVRGFLTSIAVYSDGGAKANLVHEDLGLCSPNSGSTVLGANDVDAPYLDCALYRLPAGARGVGRVMFTKNVDGRTTTVTWTPA